MPNLVPPVTTSALAMAYKQRIEGAVPDAYRGSFTPLMTMYLTDNTTPEDVREAKERGVVAFKMYPAGATTNSDSGVTDWKKCVETLKAMEAVRREYKTRQSTIDKKNTSRKPQASFVIAPRFPFTWSRFHSEAIRRLGCSVGSLFPFKVQSPPGMRSRSRRHPSARDGHERHSHTNTHACSRWICRCWCTGR